MANYAIILAAGDGMRMESKTPKCFIKVNKKPIYKYSLELFEILPQFKQIILVVPHGHLSKLKTNNKKVKIIVGGKTRNESFEKAISTIKYPRPNDKIIIHDAARINVQIQDIVKLIKNKNSFGTLCYVGPKNNVDYHIKKYNIQTPQFCLFSVYKKATKNVNGKDLFSYLNLVPKTKNFIISSNKKQNFKITFKQDLLKAKSI